MCKSLMNTLIIEWYKTFLQEARMEDTVGETNQKPKQKHKCPYPSCNVKVVHLPLAYEASA
jgi:hypothetical protein